jgi:4'-phosphopantetheinyl transferase
MSLVKIRNHYLEDISWLNSGSGDFDINGHIDIWRINISNNLPFLDNLYTLINAGEKERAKWYLQARDRNRFIISRAALRIILARYVNQQPSLIQFETGLNKKPFLKSFPVHYNVSHSGDWIGIAVANNPVGADIEQLVPAFDYRDIVAEYFSPEEAKYISEDHAHSRFFLLWTRKEALTKATGKGLDDDMKFVPALNGEYEVEPNLLRSASDWEVNSFELSPGYLAACATAEPAGHLRFRNVDLSKNSL